MIWGINLSFLGQFILQNFDLCTQCEKLVCSIVSEGAREKNQCGKNTFNIYLLTYLAIIAVIILNWGGIHKRLCGLPH